MMANYLQGRNLHVQDMQQRYAPRPVGHKYRDRDAYLAVNLAAVAMCIKCISHAFISTNGYVFKILIYKILNSGIL